DFDAYVEAFAEHQGVGMATPVWSAVSYFANATGYPASPPFPVKPRPASERPLKCKPTISAPWQSSTAIASSSRPGASPNPERIEIGCGRCPAGTAARSGFTPATG